MTKISELTEPPQDLFSTEYLKTFSKRMLKTHLFIGTFHEKRFVESLGAYRDVVRIDPAETKFIENLLTVKKRIARHPSKTTQWIGITDPETIGAPVGHNVWVELPIAIFGKYWFKVKNVIFSDEEVRLKLEVIRPLKNENKTSEESEVDQSAEFDLSSTIHNISKNVKTNMWNIYKEYVTASNFKESVIFLSLLLGTMFAGAVNIIKYLMEYMLKFIREISFLVKTMTPIIITMINMLGRTMQGLFSIFTTLIFEKKHPAGPVYNLHVDPKMMLQYNNDRERYNKYFNNPRGLPYTNRRSGPTITPLD